MFKKTKGYSKGLGVKKTKGFAKGKGVMKGVKGYAKGKMVKGRSKASLVQKKK